MSNQPERSSNKKSGAASFIKWALLIVVGIPVVWFSFCEARKAYWDWKVTQMCEQDGGQKVFQAITLQDEQYRSIRAGGKIDLPSIASAEEGDRFAYRSKTTYIVRGFPEIRRYDFQVVRRDDGKVLAEQTQFSRVGGDVLAIQPSHFSCPKFRRSLYEMTFQISE